MTKEQDIVELLKPRYKIIADWLSNQIGEVGKILELEKDQYNNWLYSYYLHDGKYSESDSTFDEYPHLFKKLAWWEERKESEMPGYVKCRFHCCCDVRHYAKDEIYHNLSIEDIKTNFFLPATEAEYLEQNQKPQ